MISFLFGVASIAAGLWGLWIWRTYFLFCVKGLLPISLTLAGVIAVAMGLSSLADRAHPSKKDHGKT